jgi:RHS repeat-associated protein
MGNLLLVSELAPEGGTHETYYTYNVLNQFTQVSMLRGAPHQTRTFSFDGFGNLWAETPTKGSAPQATYLVDSATNRLGGAGLGYDNAGNLTSTPDMTMSYDGENRLAQFQRYDSTVQLAYNAFNQRVRKRVNYGFPIRYIYGPDGKLLRTEQNYSQPKNNIYFAGRLIWSGGYGGVVPDRLGTVGGRYPYGEDSNIFATYEGEGDGGLMYAMNRHYSSQFMRFTSPDPYQASGGPADPQSWNRYAYVGNDPVNFVDPQGLMKRCPPGTSTDSTGFGCVAGTDDMYVFVGPDRGEEMEGPRIVGVEDGGWLKDRINRTKILDGADGLLSKTPCSDFVLTALQKGFLDVNGVTDAADLGQYERGIYNGLSTDLVLSALSDATFNDGGKAPTTTEGGQQYTTVAHANFVYGGTSSIDLYDPFFSQGSTGQYQTAIHEAMHLIWNIGDINFAKAVGVFKEGMTGLSASVAWHDRLKENCK